MDWKRAVWEVLLVFVIIIAAYSAYYQYNNKTDFMYTSQESNETYDSAISPYYYCKPSLIGMQDCQWINMPHGKNNIQLKQHNPFVYFIWSNQIILGIITILIFVLLDLEKAKRTFYFIMM